MARKQGGGIGVQILTKRGSPFDVRKTEELGESSNDSTHRRPVNLSPRIKEEQMMKLKIAIPGMLSKKQAPRAGVPGEPPLSRRG